MDETENKYVKKISEKSKQAIIDSSVQSLSARPTSNATEMKKRFVVPIVNDEDIPSLADEVDRVANETDKAISDLHDALDGEEGVKERLTTAEADIKVLQGHVSELSENDAEQSTRLETVEGKAEANANSISTAESNITALQETTSKDLGAVLSIDYDNSAYKLTIKLLNKEGATLGETFEIDLPLESVVVKGEYLPTTKTLVLTLQNGNIINIPLGDIIDGLIPSSAKGQPNGVASLDENGKVPTEQLPEGIGGGGSLPEGFNPEDYVKFTDYATPDGKAGVIKTLRIYGLDMLENGYLYIVSASRAYIDAKDSSNRPIVPSVLDYAIKVGITTNTETLTGDEKATACEWIGAVKKPAPIMGVQTVISQGGNGEVESLGTASFANQALFGRIPRYQNPAYEEDTPANNMGMLVTNTPTKQYHCANKKYVDDNFVAKPTDTSGYNRVIGVNSRNKPLMYTVQFPNYGFDEVGAQSRNGVPVYVNGNIGCAMPTSDYHAANKKYVDDEIAKVKDNNVTARIFIHDDIDYPSYTFLINVPKDFYEFYYMVPYELAREYLKRVGATSWETALLCTGVVFNTSCGRVYYDESMECIRIGESVSESLDAKYTVASLQLIDFYTERGE